MSDQPKKATKLDAWMNALTGWGIEGRDRNIAATVGIAPRLDRVTLAEMYRGDGIAAKIVDLYPQDAVKEGWVYKQGDDADEAAAMVEALEALGFAAAYQEAETWASLFGGALLVAGLDDGNDPALPLNPATLKAVRWLAVAERNDVRVVAWDDDTASPNFGKPLVYGFRVTSGKGTAAATQERMVHWTRCLRFEGVKVPGVSGQENDGWGDSVLVRLFGAIRNYHQAHDNVGTILSEFLLNVYSIDGLAEGLSGNDTMARTLMSRFQLMNLMRSTWRALFVDASGEKLERTSAPVTGLAELVQTTERRLCAEACIPHTLLLGESPGASLGEQGKSQRDQWYDAVQSRQAVRLVPALTKLIGWLHLAKKGPTRGQVPETWSIQLRPLIKQGPKERAEERKIVAETDAIYLGLGVVSQDEVATSRFGTDGEWSPDMLLDAEAREEPEEPEDEPEGEEESA